MTNLVTLNSKIKKLIVLVLIAAMTLTMLTGCNKKEKIRQAELKAELKQTVKEFKKEYQNCANLCLESYYIIHDCLIYTKSATIWGKSRKVADLADACGVKDRKVISQAEKAFVKGNLDLSGASSVGMYFNDKLGYYDEIKASLEKMKEIIGEKDNEIYCGYKKGKAENGKSLNEVAGLIYDDMSCLIHKLEIFYGKIVYVSGTYDEFLSLDDSFALDLNVLNDEIKECVESLE